MNENTAMPDEPMTETEMLLARLSHRLVPAGEVVMELLPVEQVAEMLSVDEEGVSRLCVGGDLDSIIYSVTRPGHVDSIRRIDGASVRAYLARQGQHT
jgi:hypothetical protein